MVPPRNPGSESLDDAILDLPPPGGEPEFPRPRKRPSSGWSRPRPGRRRAALAQSPQHRIGVATTSSLAQERPRSPPRCTCRHQRQRSIGQSRDGPKEERQARRAVEVRGRRRCNSRHRSPGYLLAGCGGRAVWRVGDKPAKWIRRNGRVKAGGEKRCLGLGQNLKTTPAATRALRRAPFGFDFGTDFWDAEGPDFRASSVCPETYPL